MAGHAASRQIYAGVAQLAERRLCNPKVGGSTPLTGSKDFNDEPAPHHFRYRLRSRYTRGAGAVGSAAGCQPEGDGFESRASRQRQQGGTSARGRVAPARGPHTQTHGDVAQLGEHLPCKQGVEGSKPFVSTEEDPTMNTLQLIGPLWRLCTAHIVQVGRGSGARSPTPSLLSSTLSRPATGRWPSGEASGCNPEDPRFDSGTALHFVVSPTPRCRIAAYSHMGA
jgi:hypothetical protein